MVQGTKMLITVQKNHLLVTFPFNFHFITYIIIEVCSIETLILYRIQRQPLCVLHSTWKINTGP